SLIDPSDLVSEELKERIDTVIQTALDASLMTRRMIEISHDVIAVEPERPGSPVEDIHLDGLVASAVEAVRGKLGPGVNLVLDLSPLPAFHGQPGPLRSMLALLISNAVESLPCGSGTITISTYVDDRNWLVLEIRDSGCGMSPEVMEHAVEPFFSTKSG